MVSSKRKRVKKDEMSPQQQQAQLLDISIEDTANSATVVKAFKVIDFLFKLFFLIHFDEK